MNIRKNLRPMIDIGGLRLPILRFWDILSGSEKAVLYREKVLEKADSKEYPRLLKDLFRIYTDEELDLNNIKSFNDKIQWLKIYDTSPLKTKLADKYLVREWIADKIGGQYLVPLIGVWNSFDEVDFDSLPDAFFLKCNHGYGFNMAVSDKRSFDKNKAKRIFDRWMDKNFAFSTLELHYRDIPRRILAEEYITQKDGNLLDYKIHVFQGEPKIIQVIGDRDLVNNTAKELFLTPEWKPLELLHYTYEKYEHTPEKPSSFEEMLKISHILGEGFCYVRVDLYNLDGQIKFGEMTFTPASGYDKFGTRGTVFSQAMEQCGLI